MEQSALKRQEEGNFHRSKTRLDLKLLIDHKSYHSHTGSTCLKDTCFNPIDCRGILSFSQLRGGGIFIPHPRKRL